MVGVGGRGGGGGGRESASDQAISELFLMESSHQERPSSEVCCVTWLRLRKGRNRMSHRCGWKRESKRLCEREIQ